MKICLDTSAYSYFQRGHALVADHIDQAEWLGVPTTVLGELWMGFNLGRHLAKNQNLLERFMSNSVVEEIRMEQGVPRLYGEIGAELRRNGTPIPTNDIWIAACAVATGSTVLTFDAHFKLISRVGKIVLE